MGNYWLDLEKIQSEFSGNPEACTQEVLPKEIISTKSRLASFCLKLPERNIYENLMMTSYPDIFNETPKRSSFGPYEKLTWSTPIKFEFTHKSEFKHLENWLCQVNHQRGNLVIFNFGLIWSLSNVFPRYVEFHLMGGKVKFTLGYDDLKVRIIENRKGRLLS